MDEPEDEYHCYEDEGDMLSDGDNGDGYLNDDGMDFGEREEEQEDDEESARVRFEDDVGLEEEEEEGSDMQMMLNGEEEYGDDNGEEMEEDGKPDLDSLFLENIETDETEYLDYNCQVCGLALVHLKDLFAHMETHDADEYAFRSDKSELSDACFGESSTARGSKKWPNRFLKFPSKVYLRLSQFQTVEENGIGGNSFHKSESESESELEREGDGTVSQNSDLIPPLKKVRATTAGIGELKGNVGVARRRYACPHCQKEFQRSDHFGQHLAQHQGKQQFECKLCGEKFSAIITLRRHMTTHPDYKPFECSKCPRRFHDLGLLKRHEESPYTHTEIEGNDPAKVHFRRKCRICFQTFGNEVARAEHEEYAHGAGGRNPLRCRYTSCRAILPNLKLISRHYEETHGDVIFEKPEKERNGNGKKLKEPFHQGLANGVRESHSQPTKQVQNSLNNNNAQPQRGGGTEECRMCFQFLFSIPERNQHEQIVHNINHPGTVLQCKYPDCRKVLGAKNWLARHIREHRQRINEGVEPDSAPTPLQFHSDNMEEDTEQESVEPPEENPENSAEGDSEAILTCRLCNKSFGNTRERGTHEKNIHDVGNPRSEFLCKFCSNEVGNFNSLLLHVEKFHKKPLPQKLIGTAAPSPSDIPSSMSTLTPKPHTKLIFPCRHCDLTFTDQHIRINHEYDEHETRDALDNFFPCKLCGKVMTLRGLRKHLRKIHGHNPHVEVADDRNGDSTPNPAPVPPAMDKLPLKQQNSSGGNKIPAGEAQKRGNKIAAGEAQKGSSVGKQHSTSNVVYKRSSEPSTAGWVCRLCFQQFDEQRQRETHEHSVHGTNSPNAVFVCKYSKCELEFGTFRALIKHLREHGETTLPTGQQRLPTATLTQYHKQGHQRHQGNSGNNADSSTGNSSTSRQALLQNDSKDSIWKCRLCWEVFPSQQHRLSHEINSHQTNHPTKSLLCKYCPKQFSVMRQLVKHLESHGEFQKSQAPSSAITFNKMEEEDEDSGPPKLELQVPQKKKHPPPLLQLK